jgi:RNA-directed DNA polymerase
MSTIPSPTIAKRPLEELFHAVNHDKRRFRDLAEMDVLLNCKKEQYTKAGQVRAILAPNETLASYLEFVRLFVVDYLPINEDVVFSYRKGVSVFDAVVRHRNAKNFFVCDISQFFSSLKRGHVHLTLAQGCDRTPISDFNLWLDRFVSLVCPESGLPVGFSTSPGISNSALKLFDDALKLACDNRGLTITRYSDDIIISGENKEALKGVEELVEKSLHDTFSGDLVLNRVKSKHMHRGTKIKLLGMVLLPDGRVSVDAAVKNEIEVLLHYYATNRSRFLECVGHDFHKGERRLSGMMNYVNTVDKAYLDKLRRKFGAAAVDYFLHRSFS